MTPRLSVIMPVYNAEKFLKESISSILNQTFTDFELLIGDDGSTDHSSEIIHSFIDDRIIVIRNEKNQGIPSILNKLIAACRNEYIARQDSDDISLPERFEKQVDFLDTHPDVGLCGTNITYFGSKKNQHFMPLQDENIKVYMLVNNPIHHPTIMFRKSCLPKLYDLSLAVSEDYAMCYELSKNAKLANLPDSLLKYRWHDSNISITKKKMMVENANAVRATIFEETLHYQIKEKETQILNQVVAQRLNSFADLGFFEKFLLKIHAKNKETAYYNEKALQRRIFRLWCSACFKLNRISTFGKIKTFLQSDLFSINDLLYLISWRNFLSSISK